MDRTIGDLSEHIDSGAWREFFADHEICHVLTFTYNLLKWLECDQADQLRLTREEFTWYKQGEVCGRFPITGPEPTPTFQEMMLTVIDRDKVVQKYLAVESEDRLTFSFRAVNPA